MRRNLSFECGSEDFQIWDKTDGDFGDFGQCFFHLALQLPMLSLLAIFSSYYIGKRRPIYAHFNDWNSCQSGIIYSRSVIVSILAVLSLSQLIVQLVVHVHRISFTETAIAGVKTTAWFLHLMYTLRLKQGNSFNTRGPRLMLFVWFCTAVISAFEFRRRYLSLGTGQLIQGKLENRGFVEDSRITPSNQSTVEDIDFSNDLISSSIEIVLQGLYFLTLIPGSTHLEQRHYRHRSRATDVLYNAYEGQESNSYTGFDEDDEELPLGTAKENTGFVSKLFFLWVTPLMKKGACGFLKTPESIFELPLAISTRNVALEFQRWMVSKGLTLLRSLHVSFGVEFYCVGILKLLSDAMGFCGPVLLNLLVQFIEDGDGQSANQEIWRGYAYVGGLFGATIISKLRRSFRTEN
jgi:ATP-binding cassette subfamily C (CFTR/MRP) protein 10